MQVTPIDLVNVCLLVAFVVAAIWAGNLTEDQ